MKGVHRSLSLLVVVAVFVLSVPAALAQSGAPTVDQVLSCDGYSSANELGCVQGVIATDKQFLVVTGTNFTGRATVLLLGQEFDPDSFGSKFLKVPMPRSDIFGQNTRVGVSVKIGTATSNEVVADVGTTKQPTPTPQTSPSPTPSPSRTPTPSPSGGQPSNPTPSPEPSVPTIENDLSKECEKQGLKYDNISGLCLPPNPYQANANSLAGQVTLGGLIRRVLNILLTLAGVIAVLMIVIGGYQYVTSQGADDKAKAGRKTVTNAAIGLIAVLLAYMLVTVVTNFVTQGTIF